MSVQPVPRVSGPSGPSAAPRLNDREQLVLIALSDAGEEFCYHFQTIGRETGLERPVVRRACRSLARKGLAKYQRGLWTEDGDPAGAGYGLTQQGRHLFWNDGRFAAARAKEADDGALAPHTLGTGGQT